MHMAWSLPRQAQWHGNLIETVTNVITALSAWWTTHSESKLYTSWSNFVEETTTTVANFIDNKTKMNMK